MFSIKKLFNKYKRHYSPIEPDEIFLDSQNLPKFDKYQFEGRIEKPIENRVFGLVFFFIFLVGLIFTWKLWNLQIVRGEELRDKSENNRIHSTTIFANRGVIYDRNEKPIVYNTLNPETEDFSLRIYATSTGLSTTLGYVKYPTKDSSGIYYLDKFEPKDGIEKIYDAMLSGKNGTKMTETDVKGVVTAESIIHPPQNGQNLVLSIDLELQKQLYNSMLDVANRAGYKGGAGVIMDVNTGEILAISNFPEYESQIITEGEDKQKINDWLQSKNTPFLNRALNGLYTPGSIVKPFIGMGVLDQKIISPTKNIYSSGSITVPNPYDKNKPSIFNDWKAHGYVDFRKALAVSSNVYFYYVSGGFGDQKGIGIENIEKYVRMFGFGTTTGIYFPGEKNGIIPNPEWKSKNFNGDIWRVGDTYNTSIGQYGFQVTPIQVAKAVSALANGGKLLVPTLIKDSKPEISGLISLDQNYFKIVKEGMRLGVTEGTSQAINLPFVKVASKTGTAQIGVNKDQVNSWVVGFWPYENPKYAYVVVMERGSKNNQFGAVLVMQSFFNWASIYAEEYLK